MLNLSFITTLYLLSLEKQEKETIPEAMESMENPNQFLFTKGYSQLKSFIMKKLIHLSHELEIRENQVTPNAIHFTEVQLKLALWNVTHK